MNYSAQDIDIHAIKYMSDVGQACRKVRHKVSASGFDEVAQEQVTIAAKELATNLVVHNALEGQLYVYRINCDGVVGLVLVAVDQGPGIGALNTALMDHSSTSGTMGCGLGAVKRLMDEFDIFSTPCPVPDTIPVSAQQVPSQCGTVVMGIKWAEDNVVKAPSWQWGGVTRALPGYEQNGDAWYVHESEHKLLAVVVDGLGHGPEAEEASQVAIEVISKYVDMAFEDLLPRLHENLRATRGVALTAVRLDKQDHTLVHAGIGNVETRLFPHQQSAPVPRPGVLGHGALPPLRIRSYPWPKHGTLILHSDGIFGRWSDNLNVEKFNHHPFLLSHVLLRDFARPRDDATVLALRDINVHA